MGLLYGRAGRLTAKNAGFRPGQLVSRGVLEPLSRFDGADPAWNDFVLLEWMMALELMVNQRKIKAILPLFMGAAGPDGTLGDSSPKVRTTAGPPSTVLKAGVPAVPREGRLGRNGAGCQPDRDHHGEAGR